MAQFDVHKNVAPSRSRVPYLLDVQADLLHVLATRVVVPLVKPAEVGNQIIRQLHFEVDVEGHRLIALTSELAAIPTKALGPRVANLAALRSTIIRALDVIISGV
jgi:toxin CcdB